MVSHLSLDQLNDGLSDIRRSPVDKGVLKAIVIRPGNGFIEANELGELNQRRLNDPKSMKARLQSGDLPMPPQDKRPEGLSDPESKKD